MDDHQRVWLWLSAAVALIVGFVLVMNDSGAGWFLIIMGIVDVGASTGAGERLTRPNPRLVRSGLAGVTLLLAVLAVVIGAGLLSR